MRSLREHFQKRYPGGEVLATEHTLEVWDKNGKLAVHMEKTGAGTWVQVGGHSDFSLSQHGYETTAPGDKHRENGVVYEHTENVKRRNQASPAPATSQGVTDADKKAAGL